MRLCSDTNKICKGEHRTTKNTVIYILYHIDSTSRFGSEVQVLSFSLSSLSTLISKRVFHQRSLFWQNSQPSEDVSFFCDPNSDTPLFFVGWCVLLVTLALFFCTILSPFGPRLLSCSSFFWFCVLSTF